MASITVGIGLQTAGKTLTNALTSGGKNGDTKYLKVAKPKQLEDENISVVDFYKLNSTSIDTSLTKVLKALNSCKASDHKSHFFRTLLDT